jgi:hypothetical protein
MWASGGAAGRGRGGGLGLGSGGAYGSSTPPTHPIPQVTTFSKCTYTHCLPHSLHWLHFSDLSSARLSALQQHLSRRHSFTHSLSHPQPSLP